MDEKPPKWSPLVRGTTYGIMQAAQQLRSEMTQCELILWEQLRERRLGGLRFRRQHTAGRYILDFYCPRAKLVVEVDGEIHDGRVEYDQARTNALAMYGYTVIRFSNEDVHTRLSDVLEEIELMAKNLISRQ